MTNIIRMALVLIYPIILLLCFLAVLKTEKYRKALKENLKQIIINTVIVLVLIGIGIIIYFKFEDTIYAYDYAGHYIRALRLRNAFFEDPRSILSTVYDSMNYNDYSSLPALFGLPVIILNTSYGFFCLGSFAYFILPTVFLLNILYFSFFTEHKYIPAVACVTFYPLYLCIFQGEIDGIGLFFLLTMYSLTLLKNYDEISVIDNLTINLCGFLIIFLRRWYLYPLVVFYLCYFFKYLAYYNFKPFIKGFIKDWVKLISSGIVLLVSVLIFFNPFFKNALSNNYSEAYAYYNHDGKFSAFINFFSIIIIVVSLLGLYKSFRKNRTTAIVLLLMTIIPTVLFARVQSLEQHHYYMVSLNVLLLFINGLYELSILKKSITYAVCGLLLVQTMLIFTTTATVPIFTRTKKIPEVREDKQQIIDLTNYLRTIITEDWQAAYMATGSSVICDDDLRNSILPNLSAPQLDYAVFDIRDGFPRNIEYISYFIVSDPIQYLDKDYQHMYEIITNAIVNHPVFSKEFNCIYTTTVGDNVKLSIYEKTGSITPEMKQYFYDEMIKYYPDKTDYFVYILE